MKEQVLITWKYSFSVSKSQKKKRIWLQMPILKDQKTSSSLEDMYPIRL